MIETMIEMIELEKRLLLKCLMCDSKTILPQPSPLPDIFIQLCNDCFPWFEAQNTEVRDEYAYLWRAYLGRN